MNNTFTKENLWENLKVMYSTLNDNNATAAVVYTKITGEVPPQH